MDGGSRGAAGASWARAVAMASSIKRSRGQVGLLVQLNHREPIEQRAEIDREVAGRYLKAEGPILNATLQISARLSHQGRMSSSRKQLTPASCGARAHASVHKIQAGSAAPNGRYKSMNRSS